MSRYMGCMSPNDLHVCVDLPLCIDCLQFSYLPRLKLNVHVFAALSHAILLMVCHHFIFNHLSYHGVKAHLPAQARYCPTVHHTCTDFLLPAVLMPGYKTSHAVPRCWFFGKILVSSGCHEKVHLAGMQTLVQDII